MKNVDTQNLFVKCVTELISFQLIKRKHFIDVSFLKHNMNQDGVNRTVFDYMVYVRSTLIITPFCYIGFRDLIVIGGFPNKTRVR